MTADGCQTFAGEKSEWRYCHLHIDATKVHGISILSPDNEIKPLDELTPEIASNAGILENTPYVFHFDGEKAD